MANHANGAQQIAEAAVAATNKQKRTRTGCLTCRKRHLKCDETFPGDCLNCRKSSRVCERGVKLNFIDTQVKRPPTVPATEDWHVDFMDESRDVASEYTGGKAQYGADRPDHNTTQPKDEDAMAFEYTSIPERPSPSHQPLPGHQNPHMQQNHQPPMTNNTQFDPSLTQEAVQQLSNINSNLSQSRLSHHSPYQQDNKTSADPHEEAKEILNTREETLYMQVFVEEVGIWMDSMDSMKHFSRLLPFHALGQPMLRNAFLACGVRHLTLVNPKVYKEADALLYYDKASSLLLRALQNPERDSVICATTAVILNVYEIMTEKALPRMNHIAGARALIKECGWNARSTGIGAACFWLNVGMELLSNLHFNWQASWHPDHWSFDVDFSRETQVGREEVWTHRIVYITAKVGDFRATIPRQQLAGREEQMWREKRIDDWMDLKLMADAWNDNIPRTMQPMAYLLPYQTSSGSAFPEVWLIKRTTIVARLFYHTCLCLLAQIHPTMSTQIKEMRDMELYHAHQICGITAHVKDRGVASVALRSLAIAGEVLTVRREQEEVLEIFKRIHRDTGWRIGFIPQTMREKWGWAPSDPSPKLPTQDQPYAHLEANAPRVGREASVASVDSINRGSGGPGNRDAPQGHAEQEFDQYLVEREKQALAHRQQEQTLSKPPQAPRQPQAQPQTSPTPRKLPPQGIVNPMFAQADFGMAKHPYQEYYVAPTRGPAQQQAQMQEFGGQQGVGGYGSDMYWLLQGGYRQTQ